MVVHGGGPQINAMLKRLAIESTFVAGLRVTDERMVEVVEMVLAGTVNKQVAGLINRAGALAVGISGKDGGLIRARKLTRTTIDPGSNIERVLDLGFVGEPERVDIRVIHALTGAGLIPVVAPVGVDAEGQTYNINADTVAGAIAGALGAMRLLMLTDVPGVLDADKQLIPELTVADVAARIADGTISGGMIPKVRELRRSGQTRRQRRRDPRRPRATRLPARTLHRRRLRHHHPRLSAPWPCFPSTPAPGRRGSAGDAGEEFDLPAHFLDGDGEVAVGAGGEGGVGGDAGEEALHRAGDLHAEAGAPDQAEQAFGAAERDGAVDGGDRHAGGHREQGGDQAGLAAAGGGEDHRLAERAGALQPVRGLHRVLRGGFHERLGDLAGDAVLQPGAQRAAEFGAKLRAFLEEIHDLAQREAGERAGDAERQGGTLHQGRDELGLAAFAGDQHLERCFAHRGGFAGEQCPGGGGSSGLGECGGVAPGGRGAGRDETAAAHGAGP